ncbi:Tyrosine kinase receptor Cad96Ca like protein [Argiope bruennichi]|uniref:receptor protein-tyrosine kinase n=1 Tax=Argiope bruennichi TaxID=94029 RepID=A0A8T0E7X6_ARGBR|nr:Tyrosine kinase receptor Cad96Ca like protein [Argiope bruennichi]
MNFFLIFLVLFFVSGKCLTSPFCCEKTYYYAEFLLSLRCGISICNSNELAPGNICISCSTAVPMHQNSSYVLSSTSFVKPYVVCKDYEVNNNITMGHVVLSWSWYGKKVFPSFFLLEIRNSSRKHAKWDFVGMTNETFADVRNLNPEVEYQFRISPAISHQNTIPFLTNWISLKELRQNISAPNDVRISKFYVKNNSVEAIVKWNASAEIPCSYIVNWFPAFGGENFQQETVTLPADSLSLILSGLEFDRNYSVIVSPVNFQNLRMSYSAEVWFVTPSCLNLTRANFSICAPGPPLNLMAEWLPSNTEAVIKWLPPTYTTLTNNVLNYHIAVGEISGLFQSIIQYKDILTVAKNYTNATISNLNTLGNYIIEVWATSKGGKGLAAITNLNTKDPRVMGLTKQEVPYYYILPILLLLFGVVILVAVSMCCRKHLKNQGFPWGIADVDDNLRRFLIPVEKIELREVVGQGAFASVHRGIYNRNKSKDDIAVKVFPAETVNRHNMLHEIEILSLIGRHDNIIGFVGFTLDVEKMYLIFEYCSYGNLHNYLVTLKPELMHMRSLPPSERPSRDYGKGHALRLSSFIYQVAKGMEYISSLKLIHRDIAARNILLYDEKRVKISDFGLSKDVYQTKYYSSETRKKLPIKWMAPEAIEKQRFNTFTDVWSFGIFMWEVFKLGKEPYPEIRNADILQFLKLGYRLEQPHCTKAWYDIMFSCWNIQPKARPRFKELVQKIEAVMEVDRTYTVLT